MNQVAELLGRVTSVVTTEPRVWLLYAAFNEGAYPGGERSVSYFFGGGYCRFARLMTDDRRQPLQD